MLIPIGEEDLDIGTITATLLMNVVDADKSRVACFIRAMYILYVELFFTYLEINPLVVKSDGIFVLDLAAKIDQTAEYICSGKWGKIEYPPPFGREAYPEVLVSMKKILF